jgi:hypothetical protein
VVGGLVEDEQVAAGEEQAGQLEAPALAAGQGADLQQQGLVVEVEAAGDAFRGALDVVAAGEAELLLQLGVVVDGGVEGVGILGDRRLLDPVRRVVDLLVEGVQAAAGDQVVVGQQVADLDVGRRLLGQPAPGLGEPDLAGRRRQVARVFRRVVLPAPLGPTRATFSPSPMRKVASSRRTRAPISI